MKILITGATGFLGKYLVDEMYTRGHEVYAFGRNKVIGKTLSGQFVEGDFTNYTDISRAVKGMDAVIHAGGLSTIWGKWETFRQHNVKGTEHVVKSCLMHNVKRFVFISSPSIYTSNSDHLDIPELYIAKNRPLNHYIKSKIEAERIVEAYHKKGLYTVTLRPRGLFGIGDTSIIPRLLEANKKSGIPMIHQGHNMVDITCVENVAYAAYLALVAKEVDGEVFNITNGEPREFKAILGSLLTKIELEPNYRAISLKGATLLSVMLECAYTCLHLKGEPLLTRYTVATLGNSQTLNIEKARDKLGYAPQLTIDEGIEKYANWWKTYYRD